MKEAFRKAHEINPENIRFKTAFDKMNSLDSSSSSSVLTSPIHHNTSKKKDNINSDNDGGGGGGTATSNMNQQHKHGSPSKLKSQDMMKALDAAVDHISSPIKTSSLSSPNRSPKLMTAVLDEDEAMEKTAIEFAQRVNISVLHDDDAFDLFEELGEKQGGGVCVVDSLELKSVSQGPCNQPCLLLSATSQERGGGKQSSPFKISGEEKSIETIWKSKIYEASGLIHKSTYDTKVIASMQQLTDAKHMIYSKKSSNATNEVIRVDSLFFKLKLKLKKKTPFCINSTLCKCVY